MKIRKMFMCAGAALALAMSVPSAMHAQAPGETPDQFAKRTQWWREAKFGMFIHWGLYAVPADSSQGLAEWYYSNHTDKDGKHIQSELGHLLVVKIG